MVTTQYPQSTYTFNAKQYNGTLVEPMCQLFDNVHAIFLATVNTVSSKAQVSIAEIVYPIWRSAVALDMSGCRYIVIDFNNYRIIFVSKCSTIEACK